MILVNGRAWPYVEVKEGCHRLRFFNAANSRFFVLKFSNLLQFTVLGRSGGYLDGYAKPHGSTETRLWIEPGGTMDTIVDFKGHVREDIELLNYGPDGPMEDVYAPAHAATTGKVMLFKVVELSPTDSHSRARCPEVKLSRSSLAALPRYEAHLAHEKALGDYETYKLPDAHVPKKKAVKCDVHTGAVYNAEGDVIPLGFDSAITEDVTSTKNYPLPRIETWEVTNVEKAWETFYVDSALIEIIAFKKYEPKHIVKDPHAVGPSRTESGWKHVVAIPPESTVVVRLGFTHEGLFTWGSTLLEHKDRDAKRPYCSMTIKTGLKEHDAPKSCLIFDGHKPPTPPREELCLIKVDSPRGHRCMSKGYNDNNVILDDCLGTESQLWYKEKVLEYGHGLLLKNVAPVNNGDSCLTIYNGAAPGEFKKSVVLWDCNSHDAHQRWTFENLLVGKGSIVSAATGKSCLDWEVGHVEYDEVVVRDCFSDSALWTVECGHTCDYHEWSEWGACSKLCGGGFRKRHRDSMLPGLTWCRETEEEERCNDWECVLQEQCVVRPVYDPFRKKCLDIPQSNAHIIARTCTGEERQRWTYDGVKMESMAIINGLPVCLTVTDDHSVRAWPCNGSPNQQWSRYFDTLVSVEQGLCLDILGGIDFEQESQLVGLESCTGRENQEWEWDCTSADACIGHCPTVCSCKLGYDKRPYCDCPGSGCQHMFCFNGGVPYYDGHQCQCRCPIGYYGQNCNAMHACEYGPWTAFTACSHPCGGGTFSRSRLPLIYPELCLDITEVVPCNVDPCLPGGLGTPGFPGGLPDSAFPGTPFPGVPVTDFSAGSEIPSAPNTPTTPNTPNTPSDPTSPQGPIASGSGCAVQLQSERARCVVTDGFHVRMGACGQSNWVYDVKDKSLRPRLFPFKCLDIEGGLDGTNAIIWDCHGGLNQQFTWSGAEIRLADGHRCLDVAGGVKGDDVFVWQCNGGLNQQFITQCHSSASRIVETKGIFDSLHAQHTLSSFILVFRV